MDDQHSPAYAMVLARVSEITGVAPDVIDRAAQGDEEARQSMEYTLLSNLNAWYGPETAAEVIKKARELGE